MIALTRCDPKFHQTSGEKRKRRLCLAVAVLVQQQFSSKVHFTCGRSVGGPLASSLLGHEFHVQVPLRFNVPKTGMEMYLCHVLRQGLNFRFRGGNSQFGF